MRYEEVVKIFTKLYSKPKLTESEHKYLYELADKLITVYGWSINDEAFLGMFDDDERYDWNEGSPKSNN